MNSNNHDGYIVGMFELPWMVKQIVLNFVWNLPHVWSVLQEILLRQSGRSSLLIIQQNLRQDISKEWSFNAMSLYGIKHVINERILHNAL
jgi:hypothetical protein